MIVLPVGIVDAVVGARERAADAEDHIGVLQGIPRPARGIERPAQPSESGCVLREGALALRLVVTGRFQQFRQFLQLRPRLGVMDALPGVDHRPLRRDQHARHLVHRLRVRPGAKARASARSSNGSGSSSA